MNALRELSVLVVASGWPTPDRPENSVFVAQDAEFLRRNGVSVGVVCYEGRTNPLNYIRARRRVRHELTLHNYDLVHAHFGQSGLVVLGMGVPVVVTFHGSDLLGVVGRTGRYTMRGRLLRAISRWVARHADRVIIAGRRLAPELPAGTIYEVIPAGVDPTVFSPGDKGSSRAALGLPAESNLVLFSGSPAVARKRYSLAAEAVRLLEKRIDVQLVTVGGVRRERVAEYMHACDVLLVTSMHESGPAMVKEALACNLPVVSVDVGDVRELIASLPGSVLCEDDHPETIAGALHESLVREDLFDGRSTVGELFQDRLTERVLAVYSDVLGANSARS